MTDVPSTISMIPTRSSNERVIVTGIAVLVTTMSVPAASKVKVWPRPQNTPSLEDLRTLPVLVRRDEIAAMWSASRACCNPRNKPRRRIRTYPGSGKA